MATLTAEERELAVRELADALLLAGRTQRPVPPPTETHPWLTLDDAYAVQDLACAQREEAGAALAGHKVGLTSAAMREQLGVSEPDFGRLYAEDVFADGATIDRTRLIAPRVEPEIAFVLGAPLRRGEGGVTAADVLAATDHVLPCLEVIDSRVADWRIGLLDTVADNASGAGVVLGTRRTDPREIALPDTEVRMTVDGQPGYSGRGADVLGDPASAVAWLVNTLGRYGVELQSGHVVLPGSMTRAVDLRSGTSVLADFGPLGTVSCEGSA